MMASIATMEHGDRNARIVRWSGLIPLTLFALTVLKHSLARQPYELLWMCNVANVTVGIGLLTRRPVLTRVGALWIVSGTAWWLGDALLTQRVELLAILTHFVTSAVAICGTTQLEPKATRASIHGAATIGLLVLQGISRIVTPPFANVNFAFESYHGFWVWFPPGASYRSFAGALLVATFVSFALTEMTLRATKRSRALVLGQR